MGDIKKLLSEQPKVKCTVRLPKSYIKFWEAQRKRSGLPLSYYILRACRADVNNLRLKKD